MKNLITFLICLMSVTVFAANPTYNSFVPGDFTNNGNTIGLNPASPKFAGTNSLLWTKSYNLLVDPINGNDSTGTRTAQPFTGLPFKHWEHAQSNAVAGDIIFITGTNFLMASATTTSNYLSFIGEGIDKTFIGSIATNVFTSLKVGSNCYFSCFTAGGVAFWPGNVAHGLNTVFANVKIDNLSSNFLWHQVPYNFCFEDNGGWWNTTVSNSVLKSKSFGIYDFLGGHIVNNVIIINPSANSSYGISGDEYYSEHNLIIISNVPGTVGCAGLANDGNGTSFEISMDNVIWHGTNGSAIDALGNICGSWTDNGTNFTTIKKGYP